MEITEQRFTGWKKNGGYSLIIMSCQKQILGLLQDWLPWYTSVYLRCELFFFKKKLSLVMVIVDWKIKVRERDASLWLYGGYQLEVGIMHEP